jgi:drug/metabolite transporter (DMT)-like permease
MTFLVLSILLSAYLGIAFKLFDKLGIDNFQAIVINYIVCVITGSIYSCSFPLSVQTIHEPWFKWSLLMGALFISIFNVIAITSVKLGVTVAQTTNKLSLVIPVIISFFLYKEQVDLLKIVGILVALVAVYLVSKKEGEKIELKSTSAFLLPILLFIGSGIIDTLTKYVQTTFLTNNETSNAYLITGFGVAGTIGFVVLMYLYATKQKTFHWKYLVAGICLGVPNYFSIYYFVKALDYYNKNSSAVIPINNIGVLFVASLVSILFFKEKMSTINYIGLALTLVAIGCIFLVVK